MKWGRKFTLRLRSLLRLIFANDSDFKSENRRTRTSTTSSEVDEFEFLRRKPHSSSTRKGDWQSVYELGIKAASQALTVYNADKKGDEYDFVASLRSSMFEANPLDYLVHFNFLAKRRNPRCQEDFYPQLFFAEWIFAGGRAHPAQRTLHCSVLKPRPRRPSSDIVFNMDRLEVFHPEDRECSECWR